MVVVVAVVVVGIGAAVAAAVAAAAAAAAVVCELNMQDHRRNKFMQDHRRNKRQDLPSYNTQPLSTTTEQHQRPSYLGHSD